MAGVSSSYSVYLLLNTVDDRTYVGYTADFERRLWQHNQGKGAAATKRNAGHWHGLVVISGFSSRKAATQFENSLHRPWLVGLDVYAATSSAAHCLTNRLCMLKLLFRCYSINCNMVHYGNTCETLSNALRGYLFDVVIIE